MHGGDTTVREREMVVVDVCTDEVHGIVMGLIQTNNTGDTESAEDADIMV